MKSFLAVAAVFLFASVASAQGKIVDYSELVKLSKTDGFKGKTHYVFVSATWCQPCTQLKGMLLQQPYTFYNVDYNRYPVARKSFIGEGGSIPQLIKLRVEPNGKMSIEYFNLGSFLERKIFDLPVLPAGA